MFNLLSITTPRSFSAELLASRSPACTVAWSLLCTERTTSVLPSHPTLPEEPVFPHCSIPIMRAIPPCLHDPNEVKPCNSAHTSTSSCLFPCCAEAFMMSLRSCCFHSGGVRASSVMLSPGHICSAPCVLTSVQVMVTLPQQIYIKALLTRLVSLFVCKNTLAPP